MSVPRHYPSLVLLTKLKPRQTSSGDSSSAAAAATTTTTAATATATTTASHPGNEPLDTDALYRVAHRTTELMRPVGWNEVSITPSVIGPAKPCSICIRMTTGSLAQYNRTSLLHVGVSDASGNHVHHFDESGHGCSRWRECVSIPLRQRHCDLSTFVVAPFKWDQLLAAFHLSHESSGVQYDDIHHNCFHYAVECLAFLRASNECLLAQDLCSASVKRVEKYYVRPSMVAMEMYLELLSILNQGDDGEHSTKDLALNASIVVLYQKYHQLMLELENSSGVGGGNGGGGGGGGEVGTAEKRVSDPHDGPTKRRRRDPGT